MTDAIDAAYELMNRAYDARPGSRLATELLESAASHAEASGDTGVIFDVHDRLIDVAFASGAVDRALAAFGRCLALCDAEPEVFDETDLHWRYKWVVEWAVQFHEVSRAQLVSLLDDAERRFTRHGHGRNAIAKLRAQLARSLGDHDVIGTYVDVWRATPRDTLSDCRACDMHAEVELLASMGQVDSALERARALVAGSAGCAEVPHLTYAIALPWLLARERTEEAADWHQRGYRMLKSVEDKWIGYLGPHLIALAALGDLGRAMRIVRETLPAAASHTVAFQRLTYLLGLEAVLAQLARDGEHTTLAIPVEPGGDGTSARHLAADLHRIVFDASAVLLNAFDTRNGNDSASRLAADWRGLAALSSTSGC